MITHIFKDGTTTTELNNVYVPSEIVERVYRVVREGKDKKNEKETNRSNGNSRARN